LNGLAYKLGRRLARIEFVRHAIADRADLEAFKEPPTFRIIGGVLLIILSFVACWPAISALGGWAVYLKEPLLVMIGGPILYVLSHLYFIAGMYLSGEKYTRILLRWAARVAVEALLARGVKEEAKL
jgi:hypothetical protein